MLRCNWWYCYPITRNPTKGCLFNQRLLLFPLALRLVVLLLLVGRLLVLLPPLLLAHCRALVRLAGLRGEC